MSEDDFSNVYTWEVVQKMWYFCHKVLALCMEGDGGWDWDWRYYISQMMMMLWFRAGGVKTCLGSDQVNISSIPVKSSDFLSIL